MIKAIALDDEPPALEVIQLFSRETEAVSLMAGFTRSQEALDFIREHEIDLIFLDVNMPAVNGMEFCRHIPGEIMVVFTTSFAEYAVESYELNAVDFLLKPFSRERFRLAIEKVIKMNRLKTGDSHIPEECLTLRIDYSIVKVASSEIEYIEVIDNYIHVHSKKGHTVVARMTMKALEEKLSLPRFIRVHRSFLVALDAVKAVRNKTLLLESGVSLPLGIRYERSFLERFNG